ncbi:hypothetical protein [Segeticoccus rhizosphaerae]|jgi:hypothetical protein|uniref:hypothetical protein n=1 Tax=Segeticoccus rhizosphaerae TaxID=1104777 RepID=UPI0010BFB5C4|nr:MULTISPECIES: hypothetical protein [Intrasporangiaceae]
MRDGIDQALKPVPAHRALGEHRRPRLVTRRLDLLLTPAEQQAWVRDRIALVDTPTRLDASRHRIARRPDYHRLVEQPDFELLAVVLRVLTQTTIPRPRATERRFWSLSAMSDAPTGEPASCVSRLATLSVRDLATAVFARHHDHPDEIQGRVCVSRAALERSVGSLDVFQNAWPELLVAPGTLEPEAGPDVCTVYFLDATHLLEALMDDRHDLVQAARVLNLRLMRQGPTSHRNGHCMDLADHVVGRPFAHDTA